MSDPAALGRPGSLGARVSAVIMPAVARRIAPLWHGATFVATATALIWQIVLSFEGRGALLDEHGRGPGLATRLIRFFSYFTIQSNILVAVVALTLMLDPERDGRVWRVLRIEAVFGITVTGIVYSTLLHGVVEFHGAAAVTNVLLHFVAPILAVVGWLVFGPRPRIEENTLILSLIWPVLYVIYTLAHGAASHWYPYPFIDVTKLGYVTALRNGVGLNLLLVGIGALLLWLDHRLPRTAPAHEEHPTS